MAAGQTLDTAEGQPLLASGVPVNAAKVAPREWKRHWTHVLGDCSGSDVAACMLAWKVPCVAWSWNQQRALTLHFGKELLRFILLTAGLAISLHAACCLTMLALCPEAMPNHDDMDDDDGPGPRGPGPHHGGPGFHGHHHEEHPPEIPQECLPRLAPAFILLVAAVIAAIVCVTLFLARRRTAMRERFGIAGSVKEDTLLYLCCAPCALAQETRTLMHEQVHDGVWYGALPGVAPPAAIVAAPAAQKMAV